MTRDHASLPLKDRVRRSVASSAAGQIGSQVVSIVSLAILLRLVGPHDYGLVGMVTPMVLFLRIFSTFGLNIATVQQRELSDNALSHSFWLTVLGGLLTTGIAVAASPLISWLYARPDLHAALVRVTAVLGGTLLISALGAQHLALLERRMQFDRLAKIRVGAQAIGAAAAILAALAGWGVWALIVQQYVELGLLTGLSWLATGWRPCLPWKAAEADTPGNPVTAEEPGFLSGALRFGGYFAAASVVLFVADFADRVLLGRLDGPETVGLYGQAKNLMIKPVYLVTTPLAAIVLSGLARAADQPAERIDLTRALYRILAIVLMPVCVGLAVVGQDVMPVLGGPGWRSAGPLLTALAVGLFAQAVLIMNGWVLAGVGRTDRLFASAVGVLVVQLLGYVAGWAIGRQHDRGALGMAGGYAVATLVVLAVPHTWFTLRTAMLPLGPIAGAIRRALMASLAMGAAVWLLRQQIGSALGDRPGTLLAIEVAAGASLYLVFAREEIRWLRAQWREMRGQKAG